METIKNRIGKLKDKISKLYEAKEQGRDDWADWLYNSHIFLVSNLAGELAEKYNADVEITQAAGMLHDVADAVMKREDNGHEEKTLEIAEKLLKECGFNDSEISIVIDTLKFHGCHGNERPQFIEGKIMAAADGIVHFQSDFYDHALREKVKDEPLKEISKWAIEKMDRDFNKKISFKELHEGVVEDYKKLKDQFMVLGNS